MSSTFKRSLKKAHVESNNNPNNNTNVNTSIGEASESNLNDDPDKTLNVMRSEKNNTPPIITNRPNLPLKGTKFWTNGCTLVSTGIRELDSILLSSGSSSISNSSSSSSIGGQPIGTCICIESMDRFWSTLSDCMVRYWCAEAISQEQPLIIPIFKFVHDEPPSNSGNVLGKVKSYLSTDDDRSSFHQSNPMIATSESINDLLDSLPRNLNIDIHRRQEQLNTATKSIFDGGIHGTDTKVQLETLDEEQWEEDGDNEDEQDDDEGLVVAWQYRKDIQHERLGLGSSKSSSAPQFVKHESNTISGHRNISSKHHAEVFCHSYNLHGRLNEQIDIESRVSILPIHVDARNNASISGVAFYQQMVSAVVSATKVSVNDNESKRVVARILLYHPDMTLCAFALPLILHYIRKHKIPAVILVIPIPSLSLTDKSTLYHIQRCSDVVLATESFSMRNSYPPPVEFRHLHGLLHLLRLSTMTQMSTAGHFADRTVQRSPIAVRYGLHRDRRKLNISLLHIPPEDYAKDGGSVSSGAVRSGGGRTTVASGCSVGDGKGQLDF